MKTIHSTTIVGTCPLGCADIYHAEFHVDGPNVTPVENIQAVINELTKQPIYQEALTQALANRVGCKVVTRGRHMSFETTCEVDPPSVSDWRSRLPNLGACTPPIDEQS